MQAPPERTCSETDPSVRLAQLIRAYSPLRCSGMVAGTMEYPEGSNLRDRLEQPQPVPIPEVLRILSELCIRARVLHDAGSVHGNLKPENIRFGAQGKLELTEASAPGALSGPQLTETGRVMGNADYISPEYMLTGAVDLSHDIYAIGVIAYEMLTGHGPFKGDSVYAALTKRLTSDPEPPSLVRSDCPANLDAIVLKAMSRVPQARFRSLAEMEAALRSISELH